MSALLVADTLVVSQKAKLVELTNQYDIHGADGAELGYLQQKGQSRCRMRARFVSEIDQFMTHRLSVYDSANTKVLRLTRPAKLMRSRPMVEDSHGRKVGHRPATLTTTSSPLTHSSQGISACSSWRRPRPSTPPSSRTRAASTSPTSWTSPDLAGAESVIRERVAVAVIACRVDPGTSPCGQSVRQSVWRSC